MHDKDSKTIRQRNDVSHLVEGSTIVKTGVSDTLLKYVYNLT